MLGPPGRPTPVGRIDRRTLPGDVFVHLPKDRSNDTQKRHSANPQNSPTLLVLLVLEHLKGGLAIS